MKTRTEFHLTRKTRIAILAGLLALLALPLVNAALADSFARVFVKIDSFFTAQQYKPYAKTIDFIFFTMFFMALYVQVIKHAFKENTKPVKFIAILLGIMSGFLLTAGGYSVQKLIPYIPWLLYFLLAAFIYRFLTAIEWPKSKGWRLFLSLLWAALLLWLLSQWLFPNSAQFGGIFDGLGRISLPDISAPSIAIPSPGSTTSQGNANVGVDAKESSDGFWDGLWEGTKTGLGEYWPWILGALVLLMLLMRRKWAIEKWKNWRANKAAAQQNQSTSANNKTIEDVKNEINEVINLKKKVWDNINKIVAAKDKWTIDFFDAYMKIIKDPAFLIDPESEDYKKLMRENEDITQVIKWEEELEKDLLELMKIEENLLGKGVIYGIMKQMTAKGVVSEKDLKGKLEEWKEFLGVHFLGSNEMWGRFLQYHFEATTLPEFALQANRWFDALPRGIQAVTPNKVAQKVNAANQTYDDYTALAPSHSQEWIASPPAFKEAIIKILFGFKMLSETVPTLTSNDHRGIVVDVYRFIPRYIYFFRTSKQNYNEIKKLTTAEEVARWIDSNEYARWVAWLEKDKRELERSFQQEQRLLLGNSGIPSKKWEKAGSLRMKIWNQIRYLNWILKLIEFLESFHEDQMHKQAFTQLQPMWLVVLRNGEWVQFESDPNGIIVYENEPFLVCTRLAEGSVPTEARFVVDLLPHIDPRPKDKDGKLISSIDVIENQFAVKEVKEKYDLISFTNITEGEVNAPQNQPVLTLLRDKLAYKKDIGKYFGHLSVGKHSVSIAAIAPMNAFSPEKDSMKFRRMDFKTLKIIVKAGPSPAKPMKPRSSLPKGFVESKIIEQFAHIPETQKVIVAFFRILRVGETRNVFNTILAQLRAITGGLQTKELAQLEALWAKNKNKRLNLARNKNLKLIDNLTAEEGLKKLIENTIKIEKSAVKLIDDVSYFDQEVLAAFSRIYGDASGMMRDVNSFMGKPKGYVMAECKKLAPPYLKFMNSQISQLDEQTVAEIVELVRRFGGDIKNEVKLIPPIKKYFENFRLDKLDEAFKLAMRK